MYSMHIHVNVNAKEQIAWKMQSQNMKKLSSITEKKQYSGFHVWNEHKSSETIDPISKNFKTKIVLT